MYIPAPLYQFAAESAETASGIGALGIRLPNLLLQMATFLIFFAIVYRFGFKTIVRILDERRQTIEDGIRLGREMESEKARLDEQVSETLHDARKQADKIIAEANQEAGEIIKSAEATAERKVEGMLSDAEAKIQQDIKRAHDGLRQEVLGLVAHATEVIIDEKLDRSKDARLIEKAVAEASR